MIKKHKKKDGSTVYMFVAYLGVDPTTRKQKRAAKRGLKAERETKIAEAKLQTEIQANGLLDTEIMTLKQVYELWPEQYRNTVKGSAYQQAMTASRMMIPPYFKDMAIKDITVPHCQKVTSGWYRTYSETKEERIYASTISEYATNLKIITDNPFNHIEAPYKENSQKYETIKYYTSDELQQFLEFVGGSILHHALLHTLTLTGVRRGGLMALTWNDIDLTNQTLNMNKTLVKGLNHRQFIDTPKTRPSIRTVNVDDKTLGVLEEWCTQQRVLSLKHGHNTSSKHQGIFTGVETNKQLNRICANETLNLIRRRDNFKRIAAHGSRHTHCSSLSGAGLSVQGIQGRLDHGDIQTTMGVYAHATEKQREKVAEKSTDYVSFQQ